MKPSKRRSTPQGEHRAVMLDEVLTALAPQPGQVIVDATLGFAGHACEILRRLGPTGMLIGLDLDGAHLPAAKARLEETGFPFHAGHANFAGLEAVLGQCGVELVHGILADLGMSSMQVDDPERGFSYRRPGPLDMRMDRSRGKTAAQILATISAIDLQSALTQLGDEPQAEVITAAIVERRQRQPLERTDDLARLIQDATNQGSWRLQPQAGKWTLHPAARTFQALRLLVNRELGNLEHLLRIAPARLHSGGTIAIISFHSGEDRLVKQAFRAGLAAGMYQAISEEPLRATWAERQGNPRARSAKLRWARKASVEA